MNQLSKFYHSVPLREAVLEGLLERCDTVTLRKAYQGESTEGMQEARQVINEFFKDLERKYAEKAPRNKNSAT